MVYLNDNETRTLWEALALARIFYQENGLEERETKAWDLLKLLTCAREIGLNINTKDMTETGLNKYQELLRKREEKQEEKGQVVKFPGT